jgi:glycosyltransferase involved in cell wall biosynthesis
MMRELSAVVPVAYVCSLGVRVPRLGSSDRFLTRVARKLRSWKRGIVRVRPGFSVVSPPVVPGRIGMKVTRTLLAWQVARLERNEGIRRPLIWVECPSAAEITDRFPSCPIVYQRTDRYEEFPGVDRALIESYDRRLKGSAIITLFCSRELFERESSQCRNALFVDHGIDLELFVAAARDPRGVPADVASIPPPRAGFIGSIDGHTFDSKLFVEVAHRLTDVNFVLVGGCTLPDGWARLPNVHMLGRREYSEVPRYMASCDVLIMPWNRNEWIRCCNPVKLKEYLATGKPIVSTPFPELDRYAGLVTVAPDAAQFAQAIRDGVVAGSDTRAQRAAIADQTWRAKSDSVLGELARNGVRPAAGKVSSS